ncbi:hypothetical protein [Streptomyces albogriseolus]|uniref:hypothetical protein n=1 Tax=Streptomyces albogriseolus TaxID=1887 RepID=UPI003CEC7450
MRQSVPERRSAPAVGGARPADGWGEHLKGQVDELQAYAGAFEKDDVIGLGWESEPCLC